MKTQIKYLIRYHVCMSLVAQLSFITAITGSTFTLLCALESWAFPVNRLQQLVQLTLHSVSKSSKVLFHTLVRRLYSAYLKSVTKSCKKWLNPPACPLSCHQVCWTLQSNWHDIYYHCHLFWDFWVCKKDSDQEMSTWLTHILHNLQPLPIMCD